jgi:hypothetical protein
VVLAAWLLLLCATTLLATGVVYGDAVATCGLQRSLRDGAPSARAVEISLSSDATAIESLDAAIRPVLDRAIAATGGDVVRIARSGSFADPATPEAEVEDLTVFESVDGLEDRVRLVDGAWPTAGQSPIGATLSDVAARGLSLDVGDRIDLVSRLDPTRRLSAVVTGIWTMDPDDALWLGDELDTTGTTSGGTYTTRGPLFVREADIGALGGGPSRLQLAWRGLPDIDHLRVDTVDALRTGVNGVGEAIRVAAPPRTGPRVATTLPPVLDEIGRSVLVSRSGVILLTIQFAILAGYAVVLVAGMLVERRRSEIALMRSRGASGSHLVLMALLEAAILAVPAAILAPVLALGVVAILGAVGPTAGIGLADDASIGQNAVLISIAAAAASVVALTLPTLAVSASPAGARAATGRQARTTLAQRLGLDLALVAVAGVALWQLRLYGAPLTRNARGTLGLDPLLVAAPAIGLVAGAVLALRIVPRVAELGEAFLARGRGLVGSLGGRQLARRPLRYTRAALLLMLAAALGTLGAAHAATWTRSQADQAAYQAVADVRAVASDAGTPAPVWVAGPRYRAIAGVDAATPVVRASASLGRTIRDGPLIALDAEAAADLARSGTAAGDPARAAALDALAAETPALASLPLPGNPARVAVSLDAAFEPDPEVGAGRFGEGARQLAVTAVLRDADGRLFRTTTASGSLAAAGQRLILTVANRQTPTGTVNDRVDPALRPTGPMELEALELVVRPADELAISGRATVTGVEVTNAVEGDVGWSRIALSGSAPGWSWRAIDLDRDIAYTPPADAPEAIVIGQREPLFGGSGSSGRTFRLSAGLGDAKTLPALVTRTFLDQTGLAVGDETELSTFGKRLAIRIVGSIDAFAPLDPSLPAAVVDLAAFDTFRFSADGSTRQANEWWFRVQPGAEASVVEALRARDAGTSSVIGRADLARQLESDPVPLGLIGVLGLGSVAAMLFAGIGFLVSSTISTSERIGEFALLRALGLSTRQLSLWLSIESVFLLVVGLVAGSLLGLLLAWLVLPFATLTQTGAAPVPAPVVVVPWTAFLPPYLAAIGLFLVTLWLVRRQLPDVRISGVLRARDS